MKKWIAIIVSVVVIVFIALFLSTGGARNDVFLHGFEVSEDGKIMTLKVDVTSSAGYLRKMEQTSGSMNPYLTFYSTFGINSKLGAKDTYQIELNENMDEVYFYKGDRGYVKVLEKDEATGEWKIIRRNSEKLDKSQNMMLDDMNSVELLKDNDKFRINSLNGEKISLKKILAPTGFAGSSLNRIELYSSGDVYWVQYDGEGFETENIVKDVLVASNASDIEMFEGEGVLVTGDSLKVVEDMELGWLKFNE